MDLLPTQVCDEDSTAPRELISSLEDVSMIFGTEVSESMALNSLNSHKFLTADSWMCVSGGRLSAQRTMAMKAKNCFELQKRMDGLPACWQRIGQHRLCSLASAVPF